MATAGPDPRGRWLVDTLKHWKGGAAVMLAGGLLFLGCALFSPITGEPAN